MKNIKSMIFLFSLCVAYHGHAQEKQLLTFHEYLNNVKNSNISYLAEKYNVDIADANIKAAKIPNCRWVMKTIRTGTCKWVTVWMPS
jgi:cobalt-zinc-cadmium efflux system outer membrane protein